MGTYIIRRLLQMIPVILGATFLIFAMVFALPGDPLAGKCGERPCPPQYAAAFREKYNLNDPLPVQYGKYLGNLAQGDLGETYNGIKVTEQLKLRYPITAKLALMAILFESILGIFAGVLTGIRKGGFLDNLVLVSTLVVISIPVFVIGGLSPVLPRRQAGPVPGHRDLRATRPFYELTAAGHGARLALAGLRHPADPHQPHREPAGRLRAHRGGQGPDPAPGHRPARACATR